MLHRNSLKSPAMLQRNMVLAMVLTAAGCATAAPEAETESAPQSATAAIVEVRNFGPNPGALKMYEFAPPGLPENAPVVLVMHGCMQSAADAAKTGWNELATELGFLVVYPEQQTGNNSMRCFNWAGEYGDPANLTRGKGENQSVREMVEKALSTHRGDPKRVFALGFSGGGGQAALLAATWPDVFNSVATFAGIPFNCTTQFIEVSGCLKPGKDKTAEDWGNRVRAAMPGYAGAWPRVSIWQGSADDIVAPTNRTQLVRQWTNVHGLSATTPSATDTVDGAAHAVWTDAEGKTVVETYEVRGMGHGVPVQPGARCGQAGQYALDKGICGARHVAKFFGIAN